MKHNQLIYLFFITTFISNLAFCQNSGEESHQLTIDIPEVALISVQNSDSQITLKGSSVTEAGKEVKFNSVDKSTWINYSSIVGSFDESNRYITIEVTEGKVPDGLILLVKALEDVGYGDGELGKPINLRQVLDKMPIKLIENIGSCYTGVGANKGHNVLYRLKLNKEDNKAYSKLDFNQSQTLAITYTLTDY